MNFFLANKFFPKTLLFFILFGLAHFAFSQNVNDSTQTKQVITFKGNVSITNNGFSVIPTFTLGKPATVVILAIGGKRFSFEPELRFSLEGKPWSFIFWGRYKLLNTHKLSINIGAHPALNFREEVVVENGVSRNMLVTRRFLAAEIAPTYRLSKNFSVGFYSLFARAIDEGSAKNTQFLAFKANFSNIPFAKKMYFQFNPQVFYLKMDLNDGFYFTSILALAKRNFPLSISSIINKAIQTNIVGKDFDWNVSLVYSFNMQFSR